MTLSEVYQNRLERTLKEIEQLKKNKPLGYKTRLKDLERLVSELNLALSHSG